jgi:transketolase
MLNRQGEDLPQLIGGSADLTGSNNTKTPSTTPFSAKDYAGRYVYYGIREFGMAAAMNGMMLHGGVLPYGGTFLIFSDYCRNAIRLSALQQVGVVYVLTHDSIGLGEDGPTHQPVEQVMSLRLIPNLNVYRPADAIETAECWALALEMPETPSVLALTRQNLAPLPQPKGKCAQTSEQISHQARLCQPIGSIGNHAALRISGRLQECPRWKRDRNTRQGDCRLLRLPHGFRAIALIQCQPRQPMITSEIQHRFGSVKAIQREMRQR